MTEPRMATVQLLTVQPLQIGEPDWCAGHPDEGAQFRVDLTHTGPEHRLSFAGERLWTAMLTQAPFATDPDHRGIAVYVEQGSYTGTLDPAGLYDLAAALDGHADQLRALADQLASILGGGQ